MTDTFKFILDQFLQFSILFQEYGIKDMKTMNDFYNGNAKFHMFVDLIVNLSKKDGMTETERFIWNQPIEYEILQHPEMKTYLEGFRIKLVKDELP